MMIFKISLVLISILFFLQETTSQILIESKNQTAKTTTTASTGDFDYGCSEGEFDCGEGECILQSHVCDKTEDCGDGLDEADCPNVTPECSEDEFDCGDNTCISKTKLCDHFLHCHNGLDEKDCPHNRPPNQSTITTTTTERTTTEEDYYGIDCPEHQFACGMDFCIDRSQLCDGNKNCDDGEDELDCETPNTTETTTTQATSHTCDANQFRCSNGKCIPESGLCDRKKDCEDHSDEQNCADVASTMITKILTSTSRRTTVTTQTIGCTYKGEWFPAGSDIVPGNCTGLLCTSGGKVLSWTDPTCAACISAKTNSIVLFLLAAVCAIANWR